MRGRSILCSTADRISGGRANYVHMAIPGIGGDLVGEKPDRQEWGNDRLAQREAMGEAP
jgi:hypothetical protein